MVHPFKCPATLEPLLEAPPHWVAAINQGIEAAEILTVEGQAVDAAIETAWLAIHAGRAYPQRQGIVCLIADQAIDVRRLQSQFDESASAG
jgi:hypothetical protein